MADGASGRLVPPGDIGAYADALEAYLAKHPEYRTGDGGQRRFLTTGVPGAQNMLVETFWGGSLSFEKA